MLKFNNSHIFTGYLKQLLSAFSLPVYRIYKDDFPIFPSTNFVTNIYIKDDQYYYKPEQSKRWQLVSDERYWFNKKSLNKSKNLTIKNIIYDSYTHEYLGEYLRYLRDYANLDLMPLYNCFSNNLLKTSHIQSIVFNTKNGKKTINIGSEDYKIYIVPVKLFQKYTIAIDCDAPVEFFCGLWSTYINTKNNYYYATNYDNIIDKTYIKINRCYFNQPFLYDGLTKNLFSSTEALAKFGKYENNLKLFIKMPINKQSSITILEGDYCNWNDFIIKDEQMITNYCATNFYSQEWSQLPGATDENQKYKIQPVMRTEFKEFKPICPLQLLNTNTGVSYPFADRLIEYLLDNAITGMDSIGDNTARLQKVVVHDLPMESVSQYNSTTNKVGSIDSLKFHISDGIWDDAYRPVIYNYMRTLKRKDKLTWFHDTLGYVDKDVEKFYKTENEYTKKEVVLNSVDLYEALYNKGGHK